MRSAQAERHRHGRRALATARLRSRPGGSTAQPPCSLLSPCGPTARSCSKPCGSMASFAL
eukprot:3951797-Lingulodinium_polyedra.AAC.1